MHKTKLFRDLKPGDRMVIEDSGDMAVVLDRPRKGMTWRMLHVSIQLPSGRGWCEMAPDAVISLA